MYCLLLLVINCRREIGMLRIVTGAIISGAYSVIASTLSMCGFQRPTLASYLGPLVLGEALDSTRLESF